MNRGNCLNYQMPNTTTATSIQGFGRMATICQKLHRPRAATRVSAACANYPTCVNLVDIARSDLMYASALPGRLRSTDAIHLATAIRLQADLMIA